MGFCRVAIDSPVLALDRPFDYAVPEHLRGRVHVGSVVRVVLHGRNVRGFVTELLDAPAVANPRPLRSVVGDDPVFGGTEIELAAWAARRYVVPLGRVLHDAVPGRFSAPRSAATEEGKVTAFGRDADLASAVSGGGRACVFTPTWKDEMDVAVGVAGETSMIGKGTLIVCPRVDQAENVARSIPGSVVLHGGERPRDRAAAWAAGRDGATRVLVGGRSALLAPLPDLGSVCVLSAHDRSLKSERAPRLHALVVARKRAEISGAAFVCSSAAPPLESAVGDEVVWIQHGRGTVRTEVVRPRKGPVTPRLIEVVRSAIDSGTDALVFAGRVGEALRLRCVDCGWHPSCPRCGAGLAPAAAAGGLVCRVCGAEAIVPDNCTSCGGRLVERGWGHERIARALEAEKLGAPVVRMIRGTVPTERSGPAVLVGTLAAVHAVESVGSVCVADLDQLLARPDFRAAERALQTLHELASVLRPGGRFLVQTREPEHHSVQAFVRRSYRFFFDREMDFRRQTRYPPFGVVVRVTATKDELHDLDRVVRSGGGDVVGTVDGRSGSTALVRAPELDPLLAPLREFAASHARAKIDVDPVDVI